MRIQVEVSEWQQACCGGDFRIGDAVTWTLSAVDPAVEPPGHPARFTEDHHDQTPDDVPHWEITGTVRSITGVTYPELPVTGEARSFRLDREHPAHAALAEVEGASSTDFSEYLVELEVPDNAVLSPFVLSDTVREQQLFERRAVERARARMEDVVGVVLEAAAGYAESTYGSVATIVRDLSRSAITIEPRREGGTAVRWARSDAVIDGISFHLGDGSWSLFATVKNAELAKVFLDAAAAGDVIEEVFGEGGATRRLDTCVRSRDGRQWVSSTEFAFVGDDGVMLVFGEMWERVQRGSHSYMPWGEQT